VRLAKRRNSLKWEAVGKCSALTEVAAGGIGRGDMTKEGRREDAIEEGKREEGR